MAKKKNQKGLNPITKTLSLFVLLIVSGFLLFNVFGELMETNSLKAEIIDYNEKKEKLSTKKEDLAVQKENLGDVDYLIRYARGKYLATKEDGEQVFKLPSEEENK